MREVARGDKHYLKTSADHKAQISKALFSSVACFVLCDRQIFSFNVYHPGATSRAISFSISNSFWYYFDSFFDGKSNLGRGKHIFHHWS